MKKSASTQEPSPSSCFPRKAVAMRGGNMIGWLGTGARPAVPLAVMRMPPSPPPLSGFLAATDSAVLFCYSLSASIADLFTSGEYMQPPVVAFQDVIDITRALDYAVALALGWLLASAASGLCSFEWMALPFEEHRRSALGLHRMLPTWLLAWPLGEAFKYATALSIAQWSTATIGSGALGLSIEMVARDGAGILVTMLLWRSWLLSWANRW
jgi:hypothetical protein